MTRATVLAERDVTPVDAERPAAREWQLFLRRLARRRTALFGLCVVAVVLVTALAAPVVSPFDPVEQNIGQRLKAPGARDAAGRLHLLGTDHLGRDLLARIIYGARPALMVGFAAVLISGVLGMAAGLIAGYFGGRMDDSSCGWRISSSPSPSSCSPSRSSASSARACRPSSR